MLIKCFLRLTRASGTEQEKGDIKNQLWTVMFDKYIKMKKEENKEVSTCDLEQKELGRKIFCGKVDVSRKHPTFRIKIFKRQNFFQVSSFDLSLRAKGRGRKVA